MLYEVITLACREILDWMIHPAMSEFHLVRAASQRQGQQLVTEADAEQRNASQEGAHRLDAVGDVV